MCHSAGSEGGAHQEDAGQSYDSVQLREYGQDQGLAEYVMSLCDACNTVGANLALTDSREQTYYTQCQTGRNRRSPLRQ